MYNANWSNSIKKAHCWFSQTLSLCSWTLNDWVNLVKACKFVFETENMKMIRIQHNLKQIKHISKSEAIWQNNQKIETLEVHFLITGIKIQ